MARYLVAGGTGNWNSTTNWSATSGGASGASFPVITDDVVIDANSANANLVINTASACLSIICSSYTGTLSGNGALTVGGNITWATGMTITSAGALNISANSTITSNGKSWPGAFTHVTAGLTFTLADDFSIAGLVTHTGGGGTLTVNGNRFICKGGFSMSSGRIFTGTTKLTIGGNSSQSVSISGTLSSNIEILSTGGIVTLGTVITMTAGTFLHTSGSVNTTTNSTNLQINNSVTINASSITWFNVTFATTAGLVCTLNSTLNTTTITNAITMSFAGTAGFVCGTYINTTSSRTHTFKAGNTYVINKSLSMAAGTLALPNAFVSSTPGTKYTLTLTNGLTIDCSFLNVTDADSSLGATGWSYKGTITTATNWQQLPTQPRTVGNANVI